jgi:hypothetical protein
MERTASVRLSGWERIVVVLLATMAMAVVGVLIAQGPASAHDHRVPKTVLMKGKEELQSGRKVWEYSWSYPSGGGGTCAAEQAVLDFGFPRVDSVEAGTKLKVRIYKSQKPRSFYMAEVDENGTERGEVSVRFKPVVRNNHTVAWNAVFRVNRPDTDYRLASEGHWKDRQGCNADQYAFWSFHVKTGDAS